MELPSWIENSFQMSVRCWYGPKFGHKDLHKYRKTRCEDEANIEIKLIKDWQRKGKAKKALPLLKYTSAGNTYQIWVTRLISETAFNLSVNIFISRLIKKKTHSRSYPFLVVLTTTLLGTAPAGKSKRILVSNIKLRYVVSAARAYVKGWHAG